MKGLLGQGVGPGGGPRPWPEAVGLAPPSPRGAVISGTETHWCPNGTGSLAASLAPPCPDLFCILPLAFPKASTPSSHQAGVGLQSGRLAGGAPGLPLGAMEVAAEPVLYQKLKLWEPRMESGEEEDDEEGEEETAEPLIIYSRRPQDCPGNKVVRLPGAWARLVAALLLLAVSCYLAVRQLQGRGSLTGSLGSVAPPANRHSHRAGVYHHGAIISPAATCSHLGQQILVAGGNVVDAGVAAALCLVVVHPHTTGLGAMFWGLFHNSSSGNATALTPGPAWSLAPGLGLPTALPALYLLHARFGHLPWPHLLMDPAMLAQEGFVVDESLASALAAQGTKGLCPLLCHDDGTPLGLGARATNPKLAAVLRKAALAPTPDLVGDPLLSLLATDLGLEKPAGPTPTLEPALQLSMPEGVLFTTPAPSAGPELLSLLKAAPHSRELSPSPCPLLPQTTGTPVSSILATVDSSGSVLLLTSSLNSSFGSGHLSPSTGVLLSNLVAGSATSPWACPLILHGSLDDPEADVLGLVASGTPTVARAMTHALLSHLAGPQTQTQHQHQGQQGPTERPSICDQGTLLQVAAHAEHAHVSSVPSGCCPFQGF
ncbi:gamma-glutamyltransferase 6 [Heterocephalus glaber]|uniref:Gamma-glutamyltransferase 6 n=1 Tax=Heterocephalus glaber TaxID=10181 RepID=A0AAX6PS19_HETGA|nr:gamma-glutamyltransferase 6 [Heterocephalus glaber]